MMMRSTCLDHDGALSRAVLNMNSLRRAAAAGSFMGARYAASLPSHQDGYFGEGAQFPRLVLGCVFDLQSLIFLLQAAPPTARLSSLACQPPQRGRVRGQGIVSCLHRFVLLLQLLRHALHMLER